MAISRWNPIHEIMSLRDAMDRVMDDTYRPGGMGWNEGEAAERTARLPLDVYTTEDEIVVIASVPGVNPDDVEITLEGDTLTIRGVMGGHYTDVDYVFTERYHGRFYRTLTLNVAIDIDKIDATFDNGVLILTLPKAEEVKPKVIKVKAKN